MVGTGPEAPCIVRPWSTPCPAEGESLLGVDSSPRLGQGFRAMEVPLATGDVDPWGVSVDPSHRSGYGQDGSVTPTLTSGPVT